MTFGVRGLVHDAERNSVFLIRHTYVPGWQLPGGGVEVGETALEALERELFEEGNIVIAGPPVLKSIHFNRQASRRDHVALYLVESFARRRRSCPTARSPRPGSSRSTGCRTGRRRQRLGASPRPSVALRLRRTGSLYSRFRQPRTVMRRGVVDRGPGRHDPRRIDRRVAAVIVRLDVVQIDRPGNARHLIEVAQIVGQVRIVGDPPEIAFEVSDIDRVEADERREQPPVGLGDAVADQIALAGQPLFELVERGEKLPERLLIGFLRRREAGAIDAVVDRRVDQRVDRGRSRRAGLPDRSRARRRPIRRRPSSACG